MGDPINIYSLMKQFLKNNNLSEKSDNKNGIEIKIIGLRPGEKLHEELFYNHAKKTNTNTILKENILIKKSNKDIDDLIFKIKKINAESLTEVKNQMVKLIDDFSE